MPAQQDLRDFIDITTFTDLSYYLVSRLLYDKYLLLYDGEHYRRLPCFHSTTYVNHHVLASAETILFLNFFVIVAEDFFISQRLHDLLHINALALYSKTAHFGEVC
jgi:hypothetical protein